MALMEIDRAIRARNLAMGLMCAAEFRFTRCCAGASPGDNVVALSPEFLNGVAGFILEMEKARRAVRHGARRVAKAGLRGGRPERGYRWLRCALGWRCWRVGIRREDYAVGWPASTMRRVTPVDFRYAAQLTPSAALICGARKIPKDWCCMRPALIPSTCSCGGAGRAVWVRSSTTKIHLWVGRGALPTGVAVTGEPVRVAREIPCGGPSAFRRSPNGYRRKYAGVDYVPKRLLRRFRAAAGRPAGR